MRLVSPRAGATLIAGTTAELEWAPLEPFADLSRIEEWEAFLSLDSGATYPLRITPHLDQDLRRVRWQVPHLPTPEASILLRFGDEHRETAVELPVRFAIAASPAVPAVWESTLLLAHRSSAPGEPAFPGRAGVVAWVDGSRRGESLRQRIAAEPVNGLRERFEPPPAHLVVAEAASETVPPSPERTAAPNGVLEPPTHDKSALGRAGSAPAPPSDILLLIQRQNE